MNRLTKLADALLKSLNETMDKTELPPDLLKAIANNPHFKDKELLEEISLLFKDRLEAVQYLYLYGQYCEIMDDLVDETVTPDMVDKAGVLKMQVSGCSYWLKYAPQLSIVENLIHNQYFDMVNWEHADEEWKRRDARALNHCAYLMLFSVILIEFGYETLKNISLRFRTHAHSLHLGDKI